jgi:hypothetical protein
MHAVIETSAYLGDADTAGLSEDERFEIVSLLAANPMAGVLMPGTGGARKLRVAGRGKGKSGGYRVTRISPRRTFRCSCWPSSARGSGRICPRLSKTP